MDALERHGDGYITDVVRQTKLPYMLSIDATGDDADVVQNTYQYYGVAWKMEQFRLFRRVLVYSALLILARENLPPFAYHKAVECLRQVLYKEFAYDDNDECSGGNATSAGPQKCREAACNGGIPWNARRSIDTAMRRMCEFVEAGVAAVIAKRNATSTKPKIIVQPCFNLKK